MKFISSGVFLVHRPLYNLIVFMSAHQNYPEFSGYRPRVFPGTPAAREVRYEPRRMNLPLGAESDWKKIKTRRRIPMIEVSMYYDSNSSTLPEVVF